MASIAGVDSVSRSRDTEVAVGVALVVPDVRVAVDGESIAVEAPSSLAELHEATNNESLVRGVFIHQE